MTLKTCKKGLHQYEGVRCNECAIEYKRKLRRDAGIPERECVYGGTAQEQRKRHKESTSKRYPNMAKDAQKKYRENVGLGYVAHTMRVRVGDVSKDILEAKAALILLNRKLKDDKND